VPGEKRTRRAPEGSIAGVSRGESNDLKTRGLVRICEKSESGCKGEGDQFVLRDDGGDHNDLERGPPKKKKKTSSLEVN